MRARFAALCLRLFGWRAVGPRPESRRCVIIGLPHTSNWDLLVYTLVAWEIGLPMCWMGKAALFRPPLGFLMRAIGGIPIHRERRENVVEQMRRRFDAARAEDAELCLLITPEGTRSYREYLKSGFYHIACAARVPIVLGYVDYRRKEAGIGGVLEPTGDVRADMDVLRAFYAGKVGRYPAQAGRLRLREEDEAAEEGRGALEGSA